MLATEELAAQVRAAAEALKQQKKFDRVQIERLVEAVDAAMACFAVGVMPENTLRIRLETIQTAIGRLKLYRYLFNHPYSQSEPSGYES
jgi:hypothetical protein